MTARESLSHDINPSMQTNMNPFIIVVVIPFIITASFPFTRSDHGEALMDNAVKFVEDELERIFESLKQSEIEKELRKAVEVRLPKDSDTDVELMAEKLSRKFNESRDVVLDLKRVIEDTWNGSSAQPEPLRTDYCCDFEKENHEYDASFKTHVNLTSMCFTRTRPRPDEPFHLVSMDQKVLDKMMENANKKLTWQHFGTQQGFYAIYPASQMNPKDDCYRYDPRERPWYALSAEPNPKQIVVVLDASSSMDKHGRQLDEIAKNATKAMLKMLSPADSVGLVYFSDHAYHISARGCLDTKLAVMTTRNRKLLEEDLDKYYKIEETNTNYNAGLLKAYEMFNNSKDQLNQPGYEDTMRVILFLSDGAPSLTSIDAIDKTVRRRPNNTKIFTFGIGNDNWTYLKRLASLSGGEFVHIKKPREELRQHMSTFYSHFAMEGPHTRCDMKFSPPFLDAAGIGMIVTASAPIVIKGKFVGAVGVDFPLSDLVEEVSYFENDQLSYAFVIDGFKKVIMHPLLPLPLSVKTQPALVYIEELERSPRFRNEILAKIMRGEDGFQDIYSERIFPRGGQLSDGINVILDVESRYSWRRVPGTQYTVVVVQAKEDMDTRIQYKMSTDNYLYHRLDLDKKNTAQCTHLNSHYASNKPGIKFALNAFNNPAKYLDLNETTHVLSYMAPTDNHFLKDGVSVTASFLSFLGQLWTIPEKTAIEDRVMRSRTEGRYGMDHHDHHANHDSHSPHTHHKKTKKCLGHQFLFKFITSSNGVLLNMPTIPLSKTYLPQKENYYRKANFSPGKTIVTPPHTLQKKTHDGFVITIARGIKHEPSKQLADLIIGADFSLNSVTRRFHDKLGDADFAYFLMDDGGYFVYNDDMVKTVVTEKTHITERIRFISEDLLKRDLMRKDQCMDYRILKTQMFYRIDVEKPINIVGKEKEASHEHCDGDAYSLRSVEGSNIYIGRMRKTCWTASRGCNCQEECQFRYNDEKCECPCFSKPKYNWCKSKFDSPSDQALPCAPLDSSYLYASSPEDAIEHSWTSHSKNKFSNPCVQGLACDLTPSIHSMNCTEHTDCRFCSTTSSCMVITDTCPMGRTIPGIAAVVVFIIAIQSTLLFVCLRKTKKRAANITDVSRPESQHSIQTRTTIGSADDAYEQDSDYHTIYRSNHELVMRPPSPEREQRKAPISSPTNSRTHITDQPPNPPRSDRRPSNLATNPPGNVADKTPTEHMQPPPPLPPPINPPSSPSGGQRQFFPPNQPVWNPSASSQPSTSDQPSDLHLPSGLAQRTSSSMPPPPPLPPANRAFAPPPYPGAQSSSQTRRTSQSHFSFYLQAQSSEDEEPSRAHTYINATLSDDALHRSGNDQYSPEIQIFV